MKRYLNLKVMLRKKPFILVLYLMPLILITSCQRDEFNFDNLSGDVLWNPTFSAPAAYGSLSLEDMLNEFDSTGFIDSDTSGLIYITYSSELFSYNVDDWLQIPDQEFEQVFFRSPVDIPPELIGQLADTVTYEQARDYNFVPQRNEKIDSITFDKGNININVVSTIKHTGIVTISSDMIMIGGQPLNEVIKVSDTTGTFEETVVIPLDGSKISLDNESNEDTTYLCIDFRFDLIHSGAGISSTEELVITMTFTDLDFKGLYGYMGDFDSLFVEADTLDFGLFEGEFTGDIYFADPRINILIENSYGIPVEFELENMRSVSKETGAVTDISIDPSVNPFLIKAPTLEQEGEIIETHIPINNTNSNIDEVVNTESKLFTYGISSTINPGGPDQNYNFVLDTSGVSMDFEFTLPMHLRAENFTLQDTLDFDLFGSVSDEESNNFEVEALLVKLDVDNGMPVEVDMQLYFTDSLYTVRDSLFDDSKDVLSSGIVDENDRVIYPSSNPIEIDLSQDKIDNLMDTKFAILKATIETIDDGQRHVKFYTDYAIDFRLGARIDLKIETSDNN